MTFSIPELKTLKLTSSKGRKEYHGESQVQAIDLKFRGAFSNEVLALFHAALPASLFTVEGPVASDDVQAEMRLPVADLDVLRFKKLRYPIKWHDDIIGATVSIFYGTGKPIVISLCKVTDFEFEPIDGGTVQIDFRVSSAADITEKVLGKTGILAGDDVEITLEPPVVVPDAPKQGMQSSEPQTGATPESIFTGDAPAEGDQAGQQEGSWPFGGDGPAEDQYPDDRPDEEIDQP